MEKKCVVQSVNQLLLLRHLQSSLCTIIQNPDVISKSHRHLTSEAGLILQRSIGQHFHSLTLSLTLSLSCEEGGAGPGLRRSTLHVLVCALGSRR